MRGRGRGCWVFLGRRLHDLDLGYLVYILGHGREMVSER